MEHTYAQALWQLLESGKTPKEAVKALRTTLERHGRSNLLGRIGRAFARIAEREGAKNSVTLTIAHERDAHSAQKAVKTYLEELDVDSKDVVVKTDASMIGGWRLEGRERLIDASFKNHLLSLYNRATS